MNIYKMLVLFFIFSGMIVAQQMDQDSVNTIEKEILEYEDTDLVIISKSRKMIIENIEKHNLQKVKDIYSYLQNKFDKKNTVIFWPAEDWFILLWLELYDELFDKIKKYPPEQNYYDDKIVPPRDLLFEQIRKITIYEKETILTSIKKAKIEPYQKEFLHLFLEYLLFDSNESEMTQEQLNYLSDQYVSQFKASEFNSFIRNYIRFVFITSDWGFGFDFYSGQGMFDGNMSKYFKDNITLGHGFDISYKKVICYLRNYIGVDSKVNRSFEYKGVWKEGLNLDVFHPEMSFGYVTVDNPTFKIAPFIGLSSMHITPPDEVKEKPGNDVELDWVTTYTFGLNVDYKFSRSSAGIIGNYESGFWFIRLRIGYSNPSYEKIISGLSGNMLYINLGIGGFARKVSRDF